MMPSCRQYPASPGVPVRTTACAVVHFDEARFDSGDKIADREGRACGVCGRRSSEGDLGGLHELREYAGQESERRRARYALALGAAASTRPPPAAGRLPGVPGGARRGAVRCPQRSTAAAAAAPSHCSGCTEA
jgi:hypothetical protein